MKIDEFMAMSRRNGLKLARKGVRRNQKLPRNEAKRRALMQCIVAYACRHIKKTGKDTITFDWCNSSRLP